MKLTLLVFLFCFALGSAALYGIDNLKLNPHLDYGSDSLDGPLITGDDPQSGLVCGKPNYLIIYGEGCFNSKRQARRTVDLYSRYRSAVHFVAIDLDVPLSPEQRKLVNQYFKGYIPGCRRRGCTWQASLQPAWRSRYEPYRNHFQERVALLTV